MFRVKYESQELEPCAYGEQEADLKDFKSSVMNERETKTNWSLVFGMNKKQKWRFNSDV